MSASVSGRKRTLGETEFSVDTPVNAKKKKKLFSFNMAS